jgi:hypothetical protein
MSYALCLARRGKVRAAASNRRSVDSELAELQSLVAAFETSGATLAGQLYSICENINDLLDRLQSEPDGDFSHISDALWGLKDRLGTVTDVIADSMV